MMNGPRRRSRNGIEAGGDPSRTTPKPYETHGDPRPLLRYRSDSGGEYYLTNKHSSQINSYL